MPESKINGLLNAIQTRFKSAFPDLKKCEIHGGRFDADELKKVMKTAPAIYLSCLGASPAKAKSSGEWELDLSLAAFIVTKDKPNLPRHESAAALAEGLCTLIADNRWDVACGAAQKVQPRNLYSGNVDSKGVALWAVNWQQSVTVGENRWADDPSFVFPTELYSGGELLEQDAT